MIFKEWRCELAPAKTRNFLVFIYISCEQINHYYFANWKEDTDTHFCICWLLCWGFRDRQFFGRIWAVVAVELSRWMRPQMMQGRVMTAEMKILVSIMNLLMYRTQEGTPFVPLLYPPLRSVQKQMRCGRAVSANSLESQKKLLLHCGHYFTPRYVDWLQHS